MQMPQIRAPVQHDHEHQRQSGRRIERAGGVRRGSRRPFARHNAHHITKADGSDMLAGVDRCRHERSEEQGFLGRIHLRRMTGAVGAAELNRFNAARSA
jgi:hypothetical protein